MTVRFGANGRPPLYRKRHSPTAGDLQPLGLTGSERRISRHVRASVAARVPTKRGSLRFLAIEDEDVDADPAVGLAGPTADSQGEVVLVKRRRLHGFEAGKHLQA